METARVWSLQRRIARSNARMQDAYAARDLIAARAFCAVFTGLVNTRNQILEMENPAVNGVSAPEQGLVIG